MQMGPPQRPDPVPTCSPDGPAQPGYGVGLGGFKEAVRFWGTPLNGLEVLRKALPLPIARCAHRCSCYKRNGCSGFRDLPMDLVSIPANPVPEGAVTGALKTHDGVTLRFARWQPPPGRKGTVCLFQGRTEFIEKYFETVRELRSRGF